VEDEVAGDGDGAREKKVEMGLMGWKMEPLSILRKSYRSPLRLRGRRAATSPWSASLPPRREFAADPLVAAMRTKDI
jgi:hypothetical protein